MVGLEERIALLADGLALIYHEARNIRFLIQDDYITPDGWERFVALPRDRVAAWEAINATRQTAALTTTATDAVGVFQRQYCRSPVELAESYHDRHWRHADQFGGHAWIAVTVAVCNLANSTAQGSEMQIEVALCDLVSARHNTGSLCDKLLGLDNAIGVLSSHLWQAAKS